MVRPSHRALASAALVLAACGFESQQAVRVQVPVVVDGTGIVDFTTNTGYAIHLTQFRAAFDNIEFTTGGEMHAALGTRLWQRLHDAVVPTAYAHPGHYAGGEIVGEMQGRFVVDWLDDGASLGDADMLEADYDGANFVFTRAKAGDGIDSDDPLIGHTFQFAGEASKDGMMWTFSGFLDEEEGKRVVGLPIGEEIAAGATTPHLEISEGDDVTLGVQVLMKDPFEPDTAFDNIDFATSDADGDGDVPFMVGEANYNLLVKQLQVHDQYWMRLR